MGRQKLTDEVGAVDRQDAAVDIVAGMGGQKEHRPLDILGGTPAAGGDAGGDLCVAGVVLIPQRSGEVGGHVAGRDGVDGDVVLAPLGGQRARQVDHAALCRVVGQSGADYIKTSTGFSTGGATLADIELMAANVPAHLKIKAAGGISSVADAEAFLKAGADRLGTSRLVAIAKAEAAASEY